MSSKTFYKQSDLEISYEEFLKHINWNNIKTQINPLLTSYKNTNLCEAIESGNEIMVDCENYHLINLKYEQYIKNLIFKK